VSIKKSIFIFISIIFSVVIFLNIINTKSQEFLDSSIKRATITFASAKALNSIISFAQGTEAGPPGITFAVGEFLDPLNDLVERFSMVMLLSIISLGIQKILLLILSNAGFSYFLISLIVICNILMLLGSRFFLKITKLTVVFILISFSISFLEISNTLLYKHLISDKYSIQKANSKIDYLITDMKQISKKQKSSFLGFSNFSISDKIDDFKQKAKETNDYIINLIIIFIFQTIFSPLLFGVVLYKLIKLIFKRPFE
jgi:hypothetical protein